MTGRTTVEKFFYGQYRRMNSSERLCTNRSFGKDPIEEYFHVVTR